MPDQLHVRIEDRNGRTLGWLGQPPQTPGWNIVTDHADAGTWPRPRAAALDREYRHGQAWRGRFPRLTPAGSP